MRGLVLQLLAVSTLCVSLTEEQSNRHRVRKNRSIRGGMCRYGLRTDCCWGWNRRPWGQCQPFIPLMQRICRVTYPLKAVCQHGCKHGECVGPNRCKCYPGYTGKTCNQDFNECGMKPRPCKHRCMNTYGSYKCYCLNGYMLMSDGSCANMRSCAMANCQYGCDEVKGDIRCRCPSPGLQLGPDRRTCVDVDECATGNVVCPRFRKCINTFGSYYCKCHDGFELRYYNGKYRCLDVDECARRTHKCSAFATCQNTPGLYKCKCITGYRGSGFSCTPDRRIINGKLPFFPIPPKDNKTTNNVDLEITTPTIAVRKPIPVTPARRINTPPLITYKPEVKTENPTPAASADTTTSLITTSTIASTTTSTVAATTASTIASTTRSTTAATVDNRIPNEVPRQRGDVFIPRQPGGNGALFGLLDIEKGITAEDNDARDDQDILMNSCNFDHGMCGWTQEKESGIHWERVPAPSGRSWYLTLLSSNDKQREVAHLIFVLGQVAHPGNLCLTFRHKLSGDSVGKIQVFVKRNGRYGHVLWERNRGHSWRTSRFTLKGPGLESIIFKGVRERKIGEISLDDINLQNGHCSGKALRQW
ncbi:nephronectin a isoform X1 [Chiloscyllium plagiosum]|uniref:nephronectin a isoform X1 n=1 Tax=Chiloscyllium plagiosum TaxID=36176 RepID=UPI001CB869A3|nr:nephronectin a isoform X1 [Chiloscyllium plagiosum]